MPGTSQPARNILCAALAYGAALASAVSAEEFWPAWRGPTLTGVSPDARPPLTWSETQNVAWKAPLPSWAGSSPIVWGDRVFAVSASKAADAAEGGTVARVLPAAGRRHPGGPDILLLCFSRKDGALLWQYRIDDGNTLYGKQNMASPSPVTDGRHVWVLSGTGVLAALDMQGREQWRQDLARMWGAPAPAWGYGSSPLHLDGKVIVEVLQAAGESYVAAFDGVTGAVLWKVLRKTDAQHECPDAYTTPAVIQTPDGPQIIVLGGNYVTAHDPKDGREIWRGGGLNPQGSPIYRIVASPVAAEGLVVAPTRVKPLLAYKADGSGDVTGSGLAWKYEGKGAPDVPTPVYHGGRLYLVDDRGVAVCLNARTGEVVWGPQRTADGTVSASPVLADGRLYVINEVATTTVLRAADAFEVLATNALDDGYTLSTPALAGSEIFIRTSSHLYCIRSGKN